MLLENPATYVTFAASTWAETDFLAEIVRRTGCGLLLDVNNVFVSATNHRFDARAYLAAFPLHAVGEIHLAGHDTEELPSGPLLIDSHGRAVADPVWALYAEVIARTGPLPTLIEWDNDVPAFSVLLAEAARADAILARARVLPMPPEPHAAIEKRLPRGALAGHPARRPRRARSVGGRAPLLRLPQQRPATGLTRALAARFPVVEQLVGAEFFTAMARSLHRRRAARTPRPPSWGEAFPAFLEAFPPLAAPSLARATSRGSNSPAAGPTTPPTRRLWRPRRWPWRIPNGSASTLHPSVELFASPHPAVRIWDAHQPGAVPGAPVGAGPDHRAGRPRARLRGDRRVRRRGHAPRARPPVRRPASGRGGRRGRSHCRPDAPPASRAHRRHRHRRRAMTTTQDTTARGLGRSRRPHPPPQRRGGASSPTMSWRLPRASSRRSSSGSRGAPKSRGSSIKDSTWFLFQDLYALPLDPARLGRGRRDRGRACPARPPRPRAAVAGSRRWGF